MDQKKKNKKENLLTCEYQPKHSSTSQKCSSEAPLVNQSPADQTSDLY